MATNINVTIDTYDHPKKAYHSNTTGKSIVSLQPKREETFVVFDLPEATDTLSFRIEDLKQAIRAIETE